MTDYKLLKQRIDESKMTGDAIAAAVGIDPSTYYRKISEKTETTFSVVEAEKLAYALKLTWEDILSIFFPDFLADMRVKKKARRGPANGSKKNTD